MEFLIENAWWIISAIGAIASIIMITIAIQRLRIARARHSRFSEQRLKLTNSINSHGGYVGDEEMISDLERTLDLKPQKRLKMSGRSLSKKVKVLEEIGHRVKTVID